MINFKIDLIVQKQNKCASSLKYIQNFKIDLIVQKPDKYRYIHHDGQSLKQT